MKKLITIIIFLTLIGCATNPARIEGGRFSLVDVRLGMAESQIIEMFGDITDRGPVYRVVMRVSGNKKLFCYGTDTSNDRLAAALGSANNWTNVFRFENGELVEYFQMAENARQCETSTAID